MRSRLVFGAEVMSGRHLRLVTDPAVHQYRERDGTQPGTAGAPCRYCGEESTQHIARQCARGVFDPTQPRCEADATYVVPWSGRRIPFCAGCAGHVIDLALAFGLALSLEPIGGVA